MNRESLKDVFAWSSLLAATIALGVIVFVKWKFVFEWGNFAQALVLISLITGFASIGLALLSFPRIPGIVALVMCAFTAYMFFGTQIYVLS
jgi:hypothetical protein